MNENLDDLKKLKKSRIQPNPKILSKNYSTKHAYLSATKNILGVRCTLSNRRQFVSLFGTNSDDQIVTCGVPQGSVLGPLLFLLYINDMPKCSNILEFHLFADDTNLFFTNPNKIILNLETILNVELEKVSQWL